MLFIIVLILTLIAGFVAPWWVAAIIAFVAAYFTGRRPGTSFVAGFFAVLITWVVLILVKTIPNDHVLASRIAVLLHLPGWTMLLIVTAIMGGIVGGMSAMSGVLVKQAVKGDK
ncbi:hypothetical protein [Mucilaginibacter myungsuensis]|uniref:Uncharacterized protein n=1 Tax=Mucilaginibacter myungsuensis TaxID=649104 RepID=A0A929PV70_9SPHI|nr:hypothetical protein [Mucilaginibacter myungsuensis]MBE9660696.1 hypothetical protein [Mucilaginibacter myungsuensis]MDN3600741.1 hypothetical protein [Mucilaginibacter myungsuensis]